MDKTKVASVARLEFLRGYRTYIGLGGFLAASVAEWAGADVPAFVALDPVNTVLTTLGALGVYERVRSSD